jgi:hypothetical protein
MSRPGNAVLGIKSHIHHQASPRHSWRPQRRGLHTSVYSVIEPEHASASYLGDSTAHDRERSSETLACVADHKHKYDELLDRNYGTKCVAESRGPTGSQNIRARRASHATGLGQEGADIICEWREHLNGRKARTQNVYFAFLSGSRFFHNT